MEEPSGYYNRKFILALKVVCSIILFTLLLCGIYYSVMYMLGHRLEKPRPKPVTNNTAIVRRTMDLCTNKQCLQQATRILNNMDATVDPCTDFYQFTCGNFTKYGKIPEDQTRSLIALENRKIVEKQLIEAYNAKPQYFNTPIKDMKKFYHQCTHESPSRERDNLRYIKKMLLELKWPVLFKNWDQKYAKSFDWLEMEAEFNLMGLGAVFINTEIKYDMRNFSRAYIGLDCTVPILTKNAKEETKYVKELKIIIHDFLKIFTNSYKGSVSTEIADLFLKTERIKPTKYELSEANFFNAFKNITVRDLEKKLNINLLQFLRTILPFAKGVRYDTVIGTNSYECLSKTISILKNSNKGQIANYMIWTATQNLLWIINNKTRELDYKLKRAVTGVQAPIPLNKMCLNFIDENMPELSSAMYLRMFLSKSKQNELEKMVKMLINELANLVNAATWMDESTKKVAREKVRRISYATGYVKEVIKDKFLYEAYGRLNMKLPTLIENIKNIRRAAYCHIMNSYHWSPEKRNRASLLPLAYVINAFYHPGLNSIAIPIGIAGGMVYSNEQEAYLNFGSMGIIIGHELSHVFDNVGRLYDANGTYVNWWSNQSNIKFEEKSKCFIKQYDKFELGPKLKLNGTLTLGENMADAGGMILAYRAYLKWMKQQPVHKLPGLEKYTLKQLFWITMGNTWCDKIRPEILEVYIKTDVHALGNFRVLGPLSNSEDFSRDFKCPINSKMNRPKKCTIW